MRYKIFFCFAFLLLCSAINAQEDIVPLTDSLTVADSVMSDEELLKMLTEAGQKDTVKKVFERGHDISSLISTRRARAVDVTPFENKPLFKNTFASFRVTSLTMANDDYSTGLLAGLAFGKWLHQDHGIRLNADIGLWYDNFDYEPVLGTEVSASYLFNLTSYAFGYRTNRLFEVSVVGGLGYTNSILTQHKEGQTGDRMGHALSGHVGAMINLRLFKNIDLFLEPQAVIYTNGIAMSNAGNWRSRMSAFRGTFGLTYNIQQSYLDDSPYLFDRDKGYFVSLLIGPSVQNSRLVYENVGLANALGVQVALSIGKYYTDYFAMRYSVGYTRGTWVKYVEDSYNCNYFSARVEGMFDMVRAIQRLAAGGDPEKLSPFSASVLFGPELGYMYKVDMQEVIKTLYMGMSCGLQAKCRLTDRLSLFLEPRFSIIPYGAPANDPTTLNDQRNYWDAVINLNAGIEFNL